MTHLPTARRLARLLLLLPALALAGCFSGEDFSACTRVGDRCGADQICVAVGRCALSEALTDAEPPPDAKTSPDEGAPEVLDLTGDLPEQIDANGRVVHIHNARLVAASTQILRARIIEIDGPLSADGLGRPGGGGGGGGAGASQESAPMPGPGGSPTAGAGQAGGVDAGGDGGQGSPGSPPGNARGGLGGTQDVPEGQPGADATFGRTCDRVGPSTPWLGDGGGAGGGGRGGSVPVAGCIGAGGGGGGAGGPGGGALLLSATERITVRGVLSARGLAGPVGDGAAGGPDCADCGACGVDDGRGGAGSAAAGPGQAGALDASAGGRGGAGSGGMILLQAPALVFEPNTALDVTGGGTAAGGGLIALVGEVQGDPLLEGTGPGLRCVP